MVRRDRRKKNRWYFRITVKTSNGRRLRIYGTPGLPGPYQDLPNSKEGATEAERRAISAAMNGKPLVAVASEIEQVPVKKTICEHGLTFVALYGPDQKPSTKRKRKSDVKHLSRCFGHIAPEDLKQADVDAFVAEELKSGYGRTTISDRLACLSSLIRYATGEKPRLRLHVKGMRTEIRAVAPADVERLLTACKDDRFRAVILLASEAGLRAGEIRGLKWADLNDGQLTVRRALDQETNIVLSPKHDRRRDVPLSPRVAEALATLPRRSEWIVSKRDGNVIDYRDLKRTISALYQRANVVRPRMILHCLRHTFGTVMARKVPLPVLKQLMGHADVQTTMRYIDVNEKDKREAIALVFGKGADPTHAPLVDPPGPDRR